LQTKVVPRQNRNSTLSPYQEMNLDDQVEIHRRALELRAGGLAYSKTISRLLHEFGVSLPKSTMSYWARGLHGPLGRAYAFSPSPIPELAYIIGVEKGDGSLNIRRKQYNYRIRLQSIDVDFVKEFDRCLSRVLNSSRHALWTGAGRNETHVEASSFLLLRFLQRPLEEFRPIIEHCVKCSAAFLRGFFDSEGSVEKSGSVTASNCDVSLLKYVQHLLSKVFDISTTGPSLKSRKDSLISRRGRTYRRNSDCFSIRISNRFRLRFLEKIGITIVRKSNRLHEILQAEKPTVS
jgi:intein-encoded DNA endonuclease-like protein